MDFNRTGRILSIDQVGIVRKSVLKRRFLTPLHLFDINFLSELGLTEDEIVSITKMVVPFGIELQKSLDLMRISALELITKELPLESADLFWQFFGRSLETKSEDAEWETICVLVEASVEKQLNLAIGMQLPKELELTKEQRSEVRELENEWRMKEIKGDLANRTVTVSKQLDRVLSKRQRYALVQRIQQQTLRSDLLVAIRPEVVKRLGIDPKIAGEFKAQLIVIDQDIKRSQLARQMEFFMKAIAILPATKRYTIIDLFDGVWTK